MASENEIERYKLVHEMGAAEVDQRSIRSRTRKSGIVVLDANGAPVEGYRPDPRPPLDDGSGGPPPVDPESVAAALPPSVAAEEEPEAKSSQKKEASRGKGRQRSRKASPPEPPGIFIDVRYGKIELSNVEVDSVSDSDPPAVLVFSRGGSSFSFVLDMGEEMSFRVSGGERWRTVVSAGLSGTARDGGRVSVFVEKPED